MSGEKATPKTEGEKVREKAMVDVLHERFRQDQKWGEQNHDPFLYGTVLLEEMGEFAQASLQTRFGGEKGGAENMRKEAVQVAAVALAIVECLDRKKWEWPNAHSALLEVRRCAEKLCCGEENGEVCFVDVQELRSSLEAARKAGV